jgi:membrane-bound lytic murein transglycosylase D
MTLSSAASNAGMEADTLKRLNPAVHTDTLDANAPGHSLLMPHRNAEQLRNAMQSANDQSMTASLSSPSDPSLIASAGKSTIAQDDDPAPASKSRHARTHTVRAGESLWQIARNYSTSVNTLERLNNLHGKALKPGQVLKLDAP